MINKFLVIMASRGRPDRIETAISKWREDSTGYADLLVALDEDDPHLDDYIRHLDVIYEVGPRLNLCPKTERIYRLYPDYKYYALLNDDMILLTKGWDQEFIKTIEFEGYGWGVCYGDDLFQHERLCTSFFFSANIPNTLGRMFPEGLQHQFCDNYYMALGQGINRFYYHPNIIVEHRHVNANKSNMDTTYSLSLSHFQPDSEVFHLWEENLKKGDITKLLNTIG